MSSIQKSIHIHGRMIGQARLARVLGERTLAAQYLEMAAAVRHGLMVQLEIQRVIERRPRHGA